MSKHVHLTSRVRRSAATLHKYLLPGVGRRLLFEHESKYGLDARLPQHYRDYDRQWKKKPQAWIHIDPPDGLFKKDEWGQVVPNEVANIQPVYPYEFHSGLWGGEGIVGGFKAPPRQKHQPDYGKPRAWYWYPKLYETVVYSEVLNQHIRLHATARGETLVDRHKGLDSYLLETPVNEVYAMGLLRLKREILLALVRGTLWPEDASRKEELLCKFEKFILPEEVADWHGLSKAEAREKQWYIEALHRDTEGTRPLKEEYRKELVGLLRQGLIEDLDPQLLMDTDKRV